MKEEDIGTKIKMKNKFSTRRLSLDLIKEDDHDFILSLVNTKGWLQFIGDRNVHSKDDSIEYIKRIKNTPDLFYWSVRLKDSKTSIGIISFLKRSYLEHFDIWYLTMAASP
jgi:flavin-dependent dehydrogenase